MVLQADGGELAVATICASMALADAGIELYDLVTACSVAYCGTQVTALQLVFTADTSIVLLNITRPVL